MEKLLLKVPKHLAHPLGIRTGYASAFPVNNLDVSGSVNLHANAVGLYECYAQYGIGYNSRTDNRNRHLQAKSKKITLQLFNLAKLVMAQGLAKKYNRTVFEEIHSGCVSGWKNPYLCI